MAFFSKIFRMFAGSEQSDSVGYQSPTPQSCIYSDLKNVNPASALQIGTVWACVSLISKTAACLPLNVFKIEKNEKKQDRDSQFSFLFSESPNKNMTCFEFWQAMTLSYLLRGNAYALITSDSSGIPISLDPLNPDQMSLNRDELGNLHYFYYDKENKLREYSADKILHWRGMGNGIIGMSPIEYMNLTLSETVASQQNALNIFSSSGKLSGIVKPQGAIVSEKQKSQVVKSFESLRNSNNGIAVLPMAMDFQQLSLTPADTQLLETRKFTAGEICRWFGVPPALIGAETGDYEKLERWFFKTAILPLCASAEQTIKKKVISSRFPYLAKFDISAMNRADDYTRNQIYSTQVQNGLRTRNEIAKAEGWNISDNEGADKLTVQSNLTTLENVGKTAPTFEETGLGTIKQ